MNLTEILKKKEEGFPIVFRGYNSKDVDAFLLEVFDLIKAISDKEKAYEKQLDIFREQEECIRSAVIKSEKISKETIMNAQKEANEIIENSKKEAQIILEKSEKQAETLILQVEVNKRKVEKNIINFMHEGRLVLDRFYIIAKKHLDALKEEFVEEILLTVKKVDEEYSSLAKIIEKEELNTKKKQEKIISLKEDYLQREESLLVGGVLGKELKDQVGNVLIAKGTVITPDLVNMAIRRGYYGELVANIEEEDKLEKDDI